MNRSTRFKVLQEKLELTPENLASHLKMLENADYVRNRRSLLDARVRIVSSSATGLLALADFLESLVKAQAVESDLVSNGP